MVGPLIGYVPGVFDLFHVGHLSLLRQADELCDVLVAGVVSDEVCEKLHGFRPTTPLAERIEIVDAIGFVDATYAERSVDRRDAHAQVGFHRLFRGEDWKDTVKGLELERRMAALDVEVVYLPQTMQPSVRTPSRLTLHEARIS